MTHAQTHHRGRLVRQSLLVPAVLMTLMTAAPGAGGSRVTGAMARATSARTVAIATEHAVPMGRKVG